MTSQSDNMIDNTSDPTHPVDPFSLTFEQLEALVRSLGGQRSHALRWFRHLQRTGEPSPQALPHLGRALTSRLEALTAPSRVQLQLVQAGADGTRKLQFLLADGALVEAVLIPDKSRMTLCLSSQAGCAMGCRFCATASMGLRRNLTAGEIMGQFRLARAQAQEGVSNIVFMGMGEPLHNWPAVRDAIAILKDPNGINFSRRRITVSTCGVVPRMEAVVREARVGLAISLHATEDAARTDLIPLNQRWPMTQVLSEARRLALEHDGTVMIQYLLLAGKNDSISHARQLAELVADFPCHVNLLTYNPVSGLPFHTPTREALQAFKSELLGRGIRVYHRESRGVDVNGACGQLALVSARGSENTCSI